MDFIKSIGEKIKNLRERKGTDQTTLALFLGLGKSTISLYENGKVCPSVETLYKLANYFEIEIDYFFKSSDWQANEVSHFKPISNHKNDWSNLFIHYRDKLYFQIPSSRNSISQKVIEAFETPDDSMVPTLYPKDLVTCELRENWNNIRDRKIYIVFEKEGNVSIKRILNRIKEENCLVLESDNKYYPPYKLSKEDIEEVWEVTSRITSNLSPPNTQNLTSIHNS